MNDLKFRTNAKFIDPLSDFGFKKIFGTNESKDYIINFINSILGTDVYEIEFLNTEDIGIFKDDKIVYFDIHCKAPDKSFLIEMQRENHANFKDRITFYTSRIIAKQLESGIRNWKLPSFYVIVIADFVVSKPAVENDYIRKIVEYDIHKGEIFSDTITKIFIELPNFAKKEEECKTMEDKWIHTLKNLAKMDKLPFANDEELFKQFEEFVKIENMTKNEREAYDFHEMVKWGHEVTQNEIRQEIADRATAEGLEKGMIEGMEKGKTNMILSMYESGLPINQIADIAKMTEDDILGIIRN